jgi:hypothetical protein
VVDASGVAAILARKNGWLVPNSDHPIAAVWSRWTGVRGWDSRELADRYPAWSLRAKGVRFTATNHVVGHGWWSWWIPLKGGDFSVGVVYDQRLVALPAGGRMGDRLERFLRQHPAARELLEGAAWQEDDVHFRRDCAYRSTTYAGDGFALVGDAAAFLDPFYSPGMDWISFTASAAAALVDGSLAGRAGAPEVARHNRRFAQSYDRWFEAVYRDKYDYMGDHELMTLAFRLDLGHYYLGVVAQPFAKGAAALLTPPFARPGAGAAAGLMALYNRRLAAIARSRWRRGTWGAATRAGSWASAATSWMACCRPASSSRLAAGSASSCARGGGAGSPAPGRSRGTCGARSRPRREPRCARPSRPEGSGPRPAPPRPPAPPFYACPTR